MSKLIAVLLSLAIVLASIPVFAQDGEPEPGNEEKVTTILEGEPAPFSGTLFNVAGAAKVLTELNFAKKTCDLRISETTALLKNDCRLETEVLNSRLEIEQEKYTAIVNVKDKQIERLMENYRPDKWYESNGFWLSVGLVSGISVTVGLAFGLRNINSGN